MKELGQVVVSLSTRLRSRSEAAEGAPVPITSPDNLPELFVRAVDRDIADRVVAFRLGTNPETEEPVLRRELSAPEREALDRRADELRRAVAPAPASSRDTLLGAISGMLGAFPTMQRFDPATALAIAANYLWTVREEPHWAIARACDQVRANGAGLNPSYCPSEPEFAAVVKRCVEAYRRQLRKTKALLRAKVDAPVPKLTKAELEAKLGRSIGERPERIPKPELDGKHASRVMAELAARRAAREALHGDDGQPAGCQGS
jgi:hypothetical protein